MKKLILIVLLVPFVLPHQAKPISSFSTGIVLGASTASVITVVVVNYLLMKAVHRGMSGGGYSPSYLHAFKEKMRLLKFR